MKPYFHTIAVATPASAIPNNGQGVTFYNDMINLVPNAMDNNIDNPNKHDYYLVERNPVGEIISQELLTNQKSAQYHGFEYYLGYATYEEALREGSLDVTVRAERKTNIAKDLILTWLEDEIIAHHTRESQLTVSGDYVKASFGGESIVDSWEGQDVDIQYYKLEGTGEIIEGENKPVYLRVARPGSISSVKLYMSDGEKSILVYPRSPDVSGGGGEGSVKEFSVRDGERGTPPNTYDRYLDSHWVGTEYEGIFHDMILAVMPFDGFVEGFWCNNTHGGNCKRDDNFPTYYTLSNNSGYLNSVYEENFLNIEE